MSAVGKKTALASSAPQAVDERLMAREWLVTNGLGGYASGPVSGVPTRRYHSILTASLPEPMGRVVMLNHISESVRTDDGTTFLIGEGKESVGGEKLLREFRLDDGLPVWRFEMGGFAIEKRVLMPHSQNTVHITRCRQVQPDLGQSRVPDGRQRE